MRLLISILFLLIFSLSLKSQVPNPSITVSPSVICSGRTVTFTSATPSIALNSLVWSISPGTGLVYHSPNDNQTLVVSMANAGRYVVTLIWDFGTLGNSTKTISVNVTKSAHASFNASFTETGFPNELVLTNFSSNFLKNYWVYDNNFAVKDTLTNTTKTYTAGGFYNVTLVAVGTLGCNDSSTYNFEIATASSLYLPTIFTPNYDGVNESFRPVGKGISTMNVRIYNRLGTLVQEWDTVNGSWDGTILSGLPADAGLYFVVVQATGFDGKSYTLKGNVTLQR